MTPSHPVPPFPLAFSVWLQSLRWVELRYLQRATSARVWGNRRRKQDLREALIKHQASTGWTLAEAQALLARSRAAEPFDYTKETTHGA